MLVCHCAVVSDRRIRELAETGCTSPLEVAQQCGAGAFCGGCEPVITTILAAAGGTPAAAFGEVGGHAHGGKGQRAVRQVVRGVEETLADAGFPVTRWLGSERELARSHGVSIGAMRQALTVLSYHGLTVRRLNGDVLSGTMSGSRTAQGAAWFLLAAGATMEQTAFARRALEEAVQTSDAFNKVHRLMIDIIARTEHALADDVVSLEDARERVAVALLDHARREGLVAGDGIGSEVDVLERLGVEAADLRAASPLLSYYSIAEPLPGPDRRWVLAKPDPWPAAQMIALHLDRLAVSPLDIFPVRRTVELQAVGLASDQIGPTGASRLRQRLREEVQGRERGQLNYPMFRNIHPLIAALSGNAVLELFGAGITLATLRMARSHEDLGQHLENTSARIAELHEEIVDAVVAGDSQRARQFMALHLDSHSYAATLRGPL